jgi:hypothetical protein
MARSGPRCQIDWLSTFYWSDVLLLLRQLVWLAWGPVMCRHVTRTLGFRLSSDPIRAAWICMGSCLLRLVPFRHNHAGSSQCERLNRRIAAHTFLWMAFGCCRFLAISRALHSLSCDVGLLFLEYLGPSFEAFVLSTPCPSGGLVSNYVVVKSAVCVCIMFFRMLNRTQRFWYFFQLKMGLRSIVWWGVVQLHLVTIFVVLSGEQNHNATV